RDGAETGLDAAGRGWWGSDGAENSGELLAVEVRVQTGLLAARRNARKGFGPRSGRRLARDRRGSRRGDPYPDPKPGRARASGRDVAREETRPLLEAVGGSGASCRRR